MADGAVLVRSIPAHPKTCAQGAGWGGTGDGGLNSNPLRMTIKQNQAKIQLFLKGTWGGAPGAGPREEGEGGGFVSYILLWTVSDIMLGL